MPALRQAPGQARAIQGFAIATVHCWQAFGIIYAATESLPAMYKPFLSLSRIPNTVS